jgi:hypothetical protein
VESLLGTRFDGVEFIHLERKECDKRPRCHSILLEIFVCTVTAAFHNGGSLLEHRRKYYI